MLRDLGTLTELVERAPTPHLTFAVRQSGRVVSGELNVSPGTPLQMEVYLDQRSAPVYGLLVGYMQVTDTAKQEETIIFNGYVTNAILSLTFILPLVRESIAYPFMEFQKSTDINMDIHYFFMSVFNYPYRCIDIQAGISIQGHSTVDIRKH